MKTIITKVLNNRVAKFIECADEDLQAQLDLVTQSYPDALVYDGAYSRDLLVVGNVITIEQVLDDVPDIKRITASQLRVQLILDGNYEKVELAIEAIVDPVQKKLIRTMYEFETVFVIDNPQLVMLSQAIGYNQTLLQDFFNRAGVR